MFIDSCRSVTSLFNFQFKTNSLCLSFSNQLASTYVGAFTPSAEDESVFNALKSKGVDAAAFPSTARWLKHVESFSAEDRAKWPVTVSQLSSTELNVRQSALFEL